VTLIKSSLPHGKEALAAAVLSVAADRCLAVAAALVEVALCPGADLELQSEFL
jgi:hypothetical protein